MKKNSEQANPAVTKEKESAEAGSPDLSDSIFSKSICSSTDCTGLIPAMPSSEEELEAYEEMYQFCLASASNHSAQPRPDIADIDFP